MKKHHITAILFVLFLIMNFVLTRPKPTLRISTAEELEKIFSSSQENINVKLASGIYELTSEIIIDSTCGNCDEPDTLVSATAGLIISGKNILQG